MAIEEQRNKGNKIKLKYVSAVSKTPPAKKKKMKVSGSHMEALDEVICQKVRQNEAERAASMEAAGRYTVR